MSNPRAVARGCGLVSAGGRLFLREEEVHDWPHEDVPDRIDAAHDQRNPEQSHLDLLEEVVRRRRVDGPPDGKAENGENDKDESPEPWVPHDASKAIFCIVLYYTLQIFVNPA